MLNKVLYTRCVSYYTKSYIVVVTAQKVIYTVYVKN